MTITIFSIIILAVLEHYCKKHNHKYLLYLIFATRKILKFADGGISEISIETILSLIKALK